MTAEKVLNSRWFCTGAGCQSDNDGSAHALPCRLEPVTKCRSHISEIGKPCKTAENAVLLAVFTQNLPTNSVEEARKSNFTLLGLRPRLLDH